MRGDLKDVTADRECQRLLADLESLNARAQTLSNRLDRDYVAVGKAWGITEGLRKALDSARAELGRINENGECAGPKDRDDNNEEGRQEALSAGCDYGFDD